LRAHRSAALRRARAVSRPTFARGRDLRLRALAGQRLPLRPRSAMRVRSATTPRWRRDDDRRAAARFFLGRAVCAANPNRRAQRRPKGGDGVKTGAGAPRNA
jgi:hypothetical protein